MIMLENADDQITKSTMEKSQKRKADENFADEKEPQQNKRTKPNEKTLIEKAKASYLKALRLSYRNTADRLKAIEYLKDGIGNIHQAITISLEKGDYYSTAKAYYDLMQIMLTVWPKNHLKAKDRAELTRRKSFISLIRIVNFRIEKLDENSRAQRHLNSIEEKFFFDKLVSDNDKIEFYVYAATMEMLQGELKKAQDYFSKAASINCDETLKKHVNIIEKLLQMDISTMENDIEVLNGWLKDLKEPEKQLYANIVVQRCCQIGEGSLEHEADKVLQCLEPIRTIVQHTEIGNTQSNCTRPIWINFKKHVKERVDSSHVASTEPQTSNSSSSTEQATDTVAMEEEKSPLPPQHKKEPSVLAKLSALCRKSTQVDDNASPSENGSETTKRPSQSVS